MDQRSVYLAKYRGAASQRYHFALFIPNAVIDGRDLTQDFKSASCKGTVIHVVGEPVMSGYKLEIKRDYECANSRDLDALVLLGHVDSSLLYNPPVASFIKEDTPRGALERQIALVPPPKGGQNVRAPVDGVNTPGGKRRVTG